MLLANSSLMDASQTIKAKIDLNLVTSSMNKGIFQTEICPYLLLKQGYLLGKTKISSTLGVQTG